MLYCKNECSEEIITQRFIFPWFTSKVDEDAIEFELVQQVASILQPTWGHSFLDVSFGDNSHRQVLHFEEPVQ